MVSGERSSSKHLLIQRLKGRGIDIPQTPPGEHLPGRYLLRGSRDKTPLFTGKMNPQSGESTSSGVFFADSLHELIVHEEGIIYVFERGRVASSWVTFPSPEYSRIIESIPNEAGNEELQERLRRSSLSAMMELESVLYQRHSVYQSRRGIATAHVPVNVADALHILVSKGYLTTQDLERIPDEIRRKIEEL